MSWVHHKKTPSSTINSSSSSSSTLYTSPNYNNSLYNTTNRNGSNLRQALQTSSTNNALNTPANNSLLMTSPYSTNRTNTSLKSSTTMRLNPTSPYQQLQQPPPPATAAQRHHTQPLQQQQQQQQLHNALQQAPLHAAANTANSHANSPMQAVFNKNNQQQNSWPAQQTGYLPSTKMMQPTPTPPPPHPTAAATTPAVAPAQTVAATNSWPQQQQQQSQQVQPNFQNVLYQQNANTPQQQWPQNPPPQMAPTATYDNYYQPPATANNNMYQQQQPQVAANQNPATFFQQPQQPPAAIQQNPQTNAVHFFDNNNQGGTTDGWGDWDWNDNSNTTAAAVAPTPPIEPAPIKAEPAIQPAVNQPIANYNNSIIADSFSNQNNNDSWNWGGNEANEQLVNNNIQNEAPKLDNNNAQQQNDNWNWNTNANDSEKLQQQQQQQLQQQQQQSANEQHNDNWNWQSTNENQQHVANANPQASQKPIQLATSPPPPPPTEFSTSSAASENHNYNTNAVTPNNIPNPVFVTQAKAVTLASRQYASPPNGGNAAVTENPPETALMPPQAFQNVEEPPARPTAVVSPPLPPPNVATPPLANVAPPAGMPPTATPAGNPFKRSGVAQHHRATALMAAATPPATIQPPNPAVFNMAPPPPADFANPASVTLMEPDNNELPSQENQEVLTPPTTTNITLPNAAGIQQQQQLTASITLPNAAPATQPLPPPNDERNQYLQTSHLSENAEAEQQPEADGLLPPPGLSRLVLGEPELEASQQRMVMGTETPNADNAVTQAAAMHLEERHADGEDTASESAVPVISSTGQGAPTTSSTLSSDRNLYLVPGESNTTPNTQAQRVVTGVELAEQREIEMDGENLEDEQIQQQQQQHQQQQQQHLQHQHQQQQHQSIALPAEARNEPPVEGADDNVAAPQPSLTVTNASHAADHQQDHHHHSSNQLTKTKDPNPISSPNDDDDSDERLLNDRGMNQSTAGSSKSRAKYENERLSVAASRRRDKRSSTERYESDEYLNSEGEYSSEREERERRERDRRRNYREGSVRSDRGINDDEDKRSRRHRTGSKRDKYYYEGEERARGREERERERGTERSKAERRSQRQKGYEADSRYETEESTRFDSRKDVNRRSMRRAERSDQAAADYDDYNRRGPYRSSKRSTDNYESDRRDRRRSDKHREPRYRDDPRYDPREYEDYRKHSSRNARESDMEKEAGVASRSGRMHHDPRHAAMYGYPSGGYYDPYTAYYYQQMARTNPQAYAEWYKKYYGQAAAAGAAVPQGVSLPGAANTGAAHNEGVTLQALGNDGRESVHSGRSSAHNDLKDRYTHAYITQANDYHRHYQQQQQHHLHQQHYQQHHQQQMAFNQSLNSTLLDDESLNHNTSLYSGMGGGLTAARSNSNLSQIHGGYYSASTAAGVYYARSDYAESRSGALSVRDPDPIAQEPQRLTPCKFITEHTVVNFASGILVTVKPKYTPNGSISNVVKLLKFKPNDETRKLFKVFPGPLVRGLTHKKTVIEFCHEQIRLGPMETTIYAKQLITNNAEKYRGSYTLMWNLLILLLKQNGMVVGTDIAELLLKNQQQFPYQTPLSTANNSLKSKSGSNSPLEEEEDLTKDLVAETETKEDNNEQETLEENKEEKEDLSAEDNSSHTVTLSEDEITEKFRNYLLYGNVNEALEWATDNNLWGHALFLASKLDRRSHANVMMKFANKLSLNDPLQTLYQLMSGRTPSSVTCIQDEKWGDWRPHLSMILSNTSQKPELDRKAITTLGDSLFNRGDLYAAHFCYLMAQVGFGRYQETATQETSLQQHLPKLVLLGSSHYKQFPEFAHNEAIVMTEIYEYACSLNDDKFSIVEFQPYKFLLATRLLDYGFHLKSLMYLEQIAVHIARDPSKYESSFINKVYEMADRLKYYDPVLEKTIDDQQQGSEDTNLTPQQMEEQKWLQNLRQLALQYQNVYSNSNANALQDPQQHQQQQQLTQDPNYYHNQQQIDQQFMEINKQFSELNLQYQQQQPTTTGSTTAEQQQQQPSIPFYNAEQPTLMGEQLYGYQQPATTTTQSLQPELPNDKAKDLQHTGEMGITDNAAEAYQQQPQYMQPAVEGTQQQPTTTDYSNNYYDPAQYNTTDSGVNNMEGPNANAAATSYDYWAQQQAHMPQVSEENARPTISMPKSKTYDTDEDNKQQHNTGNEGNKKQQQALQQQQQQKGAKKEDKDSNKNQQQSNQNSGWFGGIWNKFSLKPKNQMILPDDKNPSIVWDPEKKKWVNTDGDEDAQEALKPPPKMSDLMPQTQQQQQQQPQMPPQQQQQQQPQIPFMDPQQMQQQQQQPQLSQQQQYVPNSIPNPAPSPSPLQQQQPQQNPTQSQPQAPGPAKTPTLQSNMFKMQRNRTLKNAYVDVFNPSGAPVNKAAENILAPALPPAAVPQGGFFIPGAQPGAAGSSQEQQYQQQTQQPQQQDTPQFYNPNQFTSGTGY